MMDANEYTARAKAAQQAVRPRKIDIHAHLGNPSDCIRYRQAVDMVTAWRYSVSSQLRFLIRFLSRMNYFLLIC